MKKAILSLSAAALMLSFASCKKDYTCTCNVSANGTSIGTTTVTIENSSKGDAEEKCPESTTVTQMGLTATQTCTLND